MVFAESNLRVVHESGCGLEFNSLDALRLVDAHSGPTDQVAAAKEWMGARLISFLLYFRLAIVYPFTFYSFYAY